MIPRKQTLTVVAVAALLLTAGCAGIGLIPDTGDGLHTTTSSPVSTETPPQSTTNTTNTTNDTYTFPQGVSKKGLTIFARQSLRYRWEHAFRTKEYIATISMPTTDGRRNQSHMVAKDGDVVFRRTTIDDTRREVYGTLSNDDVWIQTSSGTQEAYMHVGTARDDNKLLRPITEGPVIGAIVNKQMEFTFQGIVSLNGDKVAKYTFDSYPRRTKQQFGWMHHFDNPDTITGSGAIYIGDDGLIRKLTYTATNAEGSVTTTMTTTHVGNVNVTQPAWLPTAKQQAFAVSNKTITDTYIAFTITQGHSLSSPWIEFHTVGSDTFYDVQSSPSIEPGDRVYLTVQNGKAKVMLTRPTTGTISGSSVEVTVYQFGSKYIGGYRLMALRFKVTQTPD